MAPLDREWQTGPGWRAAPVRAAMSQCKLVCRVIEARFLLLAARTAILQQSRCLSDFVRTVFTARPAFATELSKAVVLYRSPTRRRS